MHNPLHTPICDRLGIEYPVFLAGMGGVSLSRLVAAVSNAGGLGIMGAATLGPDQLREEIQKTRDLTDKPFAVDLLAPLPDRIRPQMEVLFEEDVRIFVAGLAVPAEFIAEMHERDMTVMVMCGRVRHAQKSEEAGADIVAAQGTEAGGHTGSIGGVALIPQIVDAVSIPVLAAGAFVDGRGLAAALAFGAQGVWMGTRFIASQEARANEGYKKRITEISSADTAITRSYSGKPMRVVRNATGSGVGMPYVVRSNVDRVLTFGDGGAAPSPRLTVSPRGIPLAIGGRSSSNFTCPAPGIMKTRSYRWPVPIGNSSGPSD